MAFKPSARITSDPYNRIPDNFPRIPDSVLAEIPELKEFQVSLDAWYNELKLALKANFDLTK